MYARSTTICAVVAVLLAAFPATANAGLFDSLTTSSAHINSCSNVTTLFSYYFIDKLSEGYGFRGRGTFRIPGEPKGRYEGA